MASSFHSPALLGSRALSASSGFISCVYTAGLNVAAIS